MADRTHGKRGVEDGARRYPHGNEAPMVITPRALARTLAQIANGLKNVVQKRRNR